MRTTVTLLVLVLTALGAIVALAPWAATADRGQAAVVGSGVDSSTPTVTEAPLPDLVVIGMSITLETGGDCDFSSTQLGVRVVFGNVGSADAGSFAVDVNGAQQTVAAGLAQGETSSLWFLGYVAFGENTAVVDVTFQVEESNEDNNTLAQIVPIPTLPSPCTPTATPTPTPTPTRPHGDVNKDGLVDSIDATLLLQWTAGLLSPHPGPGPQFLLASADVNEDSRVDAIDAALILQFGAGILDSLPP